MPPTSPSGLDRGCIPLVSHEYPRPALSRVGDQGAGLTRRKRDEGRTCGRASMRLSLRLSDRPSIH